MRPPRQIGWVISVEDWALIRRLVADGGPQRQGARQLGIGRATGGRGGAAAGPPLEDGTAALLPVLVITAAHSRFTAGRMIPTRRTEDLLLGSWDLIRVLGRVPRRLIWDNETGIGRGGKLAEGVAAFTGTLATAI